MLKSLFCEDILVEYEFKTVKLRGLSIDLKMSNLDLSGNMQRNSKHYRRAYVHIRIY